jgi:hypothetical protein
MPGSRQPAPAHDFIPLFSQSKNIEMIQGWTMCRYGVSVPRVWLAKDTPLRRNSSNHRFVM